MIKAYIAHPIGGDVRGNIKKIAAIVRHINLRYAYVVPIAPYMADLLAMNDDTPKERERGFRNNKVYFDTKFIDELWVCGTISPGVATEINWAIEQRIPVKMRCSMMDDVKKETGKEYEFGAPRFGFDE